MLPTIKAVGFDPMGDFDTRYGEAIAEFDKLLDLMEREWGYRPDVILKPMLAVSAEFNIKGFEHKGRMVLMRKRTPKQVARVIADEISTHRNTCVDCGEGIAGIYVRVRAAEDERSYFRHHDRVKSYGRWDVPADGVERELHPHYAKRLDKALKEQGVIV